MSNENETRNFENRLPANFQVPDSNSEAVGFKNRLRQAVNMAGGPQVVSLNSKVPLSTLQGYLRGGDPKFSNVMALAKACGVSVSWLATGAPPMIEDGHPLPPLLQKPTVSQPFKAVGNIDQRHLAHCLDLAQKLFEEHGAQPDMDDIVYVALGLYDSISKPSIDHHK
jgi:hypothetical protein